MSSNSCVDARMGTSASSPAAPLFSPSALPVLLIDGQRWVRLCVPPAELRLDITLSNGQCFGWRRVDAAARQELTAKMAARGKRKRTPVKAEQNEEVTAAGQEFSSPSAAAGLSAADNSQQSSVQVKLESEQSEDGATAASMAAAASLPQPMSDSVPPVLVKSEPMDEQLLPAAASSHASAAAMSPVPPVPSSSPSSDPHYVGVLGQSLLGFRQTDTDVLYREHWSAEPTPPEQLDALLRDYLHLPSRRADPQTGVPAHADMCLVDLYSAWSRNSTERFRTLARVFPGVRLLRQDPLETLFSFICSSNNHISRIGGMLLALRRRYGQQLQIPADVLRALFPDDDSPPPFHAFPTLDALCAATESELRDLGFGYRAKFIVQTALQLRELGGTAYLSSLRLRPRAEAEKALASFAGVGPKVASCVALFSLDALDAIPVDTHVWKISLRDYPRTAQELGLVANGELDLSQVKSLTPRVITAVGDVFRALFGAYAGWAHCILFLAELPEYKRRLAALGLLAPTAQASPIDAAPAGTSSSAVSASSPTPAAEDPDETEDDADMDTPATPAAPAVKPTPQPATGDANGKKKQQRRRREEQKAAEISSAFPQRKRR